MLSVGHQERLGDVGVEEAAKINVNRSNITGYGRCLFKSLELLLKNLDKVQGVHFSSVRARRGTRLGASLPGMQSAEQLLGDDCLVGTGHVLEAGVEDGQIVRKGPYQLQPRLVVRPKSRPVEVHVNDVDLPLSRVPRLGIVLYFVVADGDDKVCVAEEFVPRLIPPQAYAAKEEVGQVSGDGTSSL